MISPSNVVIPYNDHKDIVSLILFNLKDPQQSLVCKLWHQVNNSFVYPMLLKTYRDQEFVSRFTLHLPSQIIGLDNLEKVKEIFFKVRKLVTFFKIQNEIKNERTKGLCPLDLLSIMKIVEDTALVSLFSDLSILLTGIFFTDEAKEIRILIEANNESCKTSILKIKTPYLPQEIGNFVNLQILNLEDSKLEILPSQIKMLTNLNLLNLANNCLPIVPKEICKLVNLKKLNLRKNRMKVLPQKISKLINLKWLDLSKNKLEVLLPEIGQLVNLECLYLCSNKLKALPVQIGQLTNLYKLYPSSNQLTELTPEIGNLTNLQKLYIENNQFTEMPSEIGKLTNLIFLSLKINPLKKTLPSELCQLTSLESITIDESLKHLLPSDISKLNILEITFFKKYEESSTEEECSTEEESSDSESIED